MPLELETATAEEELSKATREHLAFAAGLRELADWIEDHPEIPLPEKEISIYSLNEKEEAVMLVRALGRCDKDYREEMFYISRRFGPICLRAVFYRSKVCTARVVGVETVLAEYIPASTRPARTVEKIEWDCEPLLRPDEALA